MRMTEEQVAAHKRMVTNHRSIEPLDRVKPKAEQKTRGPQPNPSAPRSKYRSKRCEIDGIAFASMKEGRRYGELKLMQAAGEINGLLCHPIYPLIVNEVNVGKYIGDFFYQRGTEGILEDVKGVKTAVYRLKKRMVKAIYNIEILET